MYVDEDTMWQSYDDKGWTVWAELEEYRRAWQDVYRQYWGVNHTTCPEHLTDELWQITKGVGTLTGSLPTMLIALNLNAVVQGGREIYWGEEQTALIREILRSQGKLRHLKDGIEIDLAGKALAQLKEAGKRLLRLSGLIQGRTMSPRASEFIKRATTLYVWGFEVESLIMCRSALEAALEARLAELISLDVPPPPLDELIRLAGVNLVLEGFEKVKHSKKGWRARKGSGLWQAMRIKVGGNYAIHTRPAIRGEEDDIPDAFNAIRELSKLLGILFPV